MIVVDVLHLSKMVKWVFSDFVDSTVEFVLAFVKQVEAEIQNGGQFRKDLRRTKKKILKSIILPVVERQKSKLDCCDWR